ncbi:hypothetical protein B5F07_06130 [Lachnoclostridium sp. An169]|nr:hypothetical protein B5F07_06130 [Lachnoclostridium sp. An169]
MISGSGKALCIIRLQLLFIFRRLSGCAAPYCRGDHAFARECNAAVLRLQKTQPKNRRSTTGLRSNTGLHSLENSGRMKSNCIRIFSSHISAGSSYIV